MATAAYKNDQGIVGVPSGLTDLDDRLGGITQTRFNNNSWKTLNGKNCTCNKHCFQCLIKY